MKRYPDMRETELSWTNSLPAHWDERRGKFLFDLKKRPIREEDDVITAFRDGQVTLRTKRRTEGFTNSLKEIGYQGVREGDLVIHAMDGFAGAIGVSDSDGKCSPVYSCCVGRKGINADFYAYLLRNMAKTGFIESLAKGIRERSTDFRWNDFAELGLPLPPAQEQTRISTALDRETARIDALIEKKTRFIELLKEKRQALITQAVTKGLDPDVPMRDSGVEWIGQVPEGWEMKSFRHVLGPHGYKAGPFGGSLITDKLDQSGNILVLSPEHVAKKGASFSDELFLPEKRRREMSQFFLKDGDIAFPIVGTLGRSWVYRRDGEAIINQRLARIRVDTQKVLPEYLSMLFSEFAYFKELDAMEGKGAILSHLTKEQILGRWFPLPPILDQQDILDHLDCVVGKVDHAMNLTKKSIGLLTERRSALITAAVTGQIDLREAV